VSAVVAAFALVMGVLIMADESAQQTDLLEEQTRIEQLNSIQIDRQSFELESQNELMRQQMGRSECVDHLRAELAGIQVIATASGGDLTSDVEAYSQIMKDLIDDCFTSDGVFNE
jgi:hypothetical protein